MSSDRIERALGEVTREASNEPLPEVDWEAMEARLPMTQVRARPPRAFNVMPWLYAATFVLGAGGLGLTLARPFERAPPVAQAGGPGPLPRATPTAVKDMNGDELALGTHVAAGDLPQSVVHAGHARWTLAPHSEGTLLASGELVTVRLDRGAVTSRVTKSSRTETFAVEAADVRVAAHGTEFIVLLGADGVSVSVTEGSVLVGLREEPGTGQLLISPAAKRYTLAGLPLAGGAGLGALGALRAGGSGRPDTAIDSSASSSGATDPGAVLAAGAPKHAAAHKLEPAEAAPVEENLAPEQPSSEGLDTATMAVQFLTQTCFKERTIAGEGVRVTAQSSLTFRTLPQGGVSKVVFEPPLSPAVQACVSAGMGAIRTEATRHGFQVSRGIDLER